MKRHVTIILMQIQMTVHVRILMKERVIVTVMSLTAREFVAAQQLHRNSLLLRQMWIVMG